MSYDGDFGPIILLWQGKNGNQGKDTVSLWLIRRKIKMEFKKKIK